MRWKAAVAVVLMVSAWGCSSGGDKGSTAANGKESASTSASAPATAEQAFARLDPAAFADRMNDKNAVLIDVHVPYEGELENTDAFIPFDKIVGDSRLPKDKDAEILLYCRTGRMSEEAGNALHNAGYTNLSHLEGGMRGWEAAGHKLIQNPAHAAPETATTHKM
ncbi:MAG: rhodanese-like domain-containing protein [Actinobacteria bacterium]|nr:rhodanese-like domain-containing protein [Actinomycetota bacterium]